MEKKTHPSIICTICARGGSKGLPGKNIKMLQSLPLIAHSIICAKNTGIFDDIVVSSDSDEILDIAKKYGATQIVKRPNELANDFAPKIPAIRHCVQTIESSLGKTYDIIIDLDSTSPLRAEEDILGALELFYNKQANNVITGSTSHRSPYFNLVEKCKKSGNVSTAKKLVESSIVRRQDAPETYDMNASIYIWRKNWLFEHDNLFNEKTFLYEMPRSRSFDIDSALDFKIVEYILEENLNA